MATVDPDRDYQAQLALLSQQNKRFTGQEPDPEWIRSGLDARVGNMFMDGELICTRCLDAIFQKDPSVWGEISSKVHLPAPEHAKSGPDLHQCFCGYFNFNYQGLERHLEDHLYDEALVMGLLERLKQVDMHEECQEKLAIGMCKDKVSR